MSLEYIAEDLRSLAVPIETLHEDPANARQHNDHNLREIAASLREHGQRTPIVAAPDGRVIAGNARLRVARDILGWSHIAVSRYDASEIDQLRYALRDNRTAELAEWDAKILEQLKEIEGVDLDGLGFELEEEISRLTQRFEAAREKPEIPSDLEQLVERFGVAPGQLWRIAGEAEHLLWIGDAGNRDALKALAERVGAQYLVFDPPWDQFDFDTWLPPRRGTVAFCDAKNFALPIRMFGAPNWLFVWHCQQGMKLNNRPIQQCKHALLYLDSWDSFQHDRWLCPQTDSSKGVISDHYVEGIAAHHESGFHKYEKPLDWITLIIANCFDGPVIDPFAGSGTSMLASERIGRPSASIEIEPRYGALILMRAMIAGMEIEREADSWP